jgi:hypothetical protein
MRVHGDASRFTTAGKAVVECKLLRTIFPGVRSSWESGEGSRRKHSAKYVAMASSRKHGQEGRRFRHLAFYSLHSSSALQPASAVPRATPALYTPTKQASPTGKLETLQSSGRLHTGDIASFQTTCTTAKAFRSVKGTSLLMHRCDNLIVQLIPDIFLGPWPKRADKRGPRRRNNTGPRYKSL